MFDLRGNGRTNFTVPPAWMQNGVIILPVTYQAEGVFRAKVTRTDAANEDLATSAESLVNGEYGLTQVVEANGEAYFLYFVREQDRVWVLIPVNEQSYMKLRLLRAHLALCCLLLLPSYSLAFGSLFYTAAPFSGQVVDAGTGQPIEGANVVANWELVHGSLDGERHVRQLEVKETVTDASGHFAFQGFTRLNPTLDELRNADPRVIVFKGGYEAGIFYGPIRDTYSGSVRRASVDQRLLKITTLKAMEFGPKGFEHPAFHFILGGYIEDIIADCEWKKIPKFLIALDNENQRLRSAYPNAYLRIGADALEGMSKRECKLSAKTFADLKK